MRACLICGGNQTTVHGDFKCDGMKNMENLVLMDVDMYVCEECGEREVSIPHIEELHDFLFKKERRIKFFLEGWKDVSDKK